MTNGSGAGIVVDDVARSFGGVEAVSAMSFTIAPATITGLVGPNGAGKTTVFNVITGVLRPDRGRVMLGPIELHRLSPSEIVKAGIARSFQDLRLFTRLSALENVLVAQATHRNYLAQILTPDSDAIQRRERAGELLDRVGLGRDAETIAGSLSFAQQKLLAVARLLATGAQLLLLDEPAAGLDERSVTAMVELLRSLVRDGVGICVIEHNMDCIKKLCDRVVFVASGRTIAEGTPEEIMGRADLAEIFFGKRHAA